MDGLYICKTRIIGYIYIGYIYVGYLHMHNTLMLGTLPDSIGVSRTSFEELPRSSSIGTPPPLPDWVEVLEVDFRRSKVLGMYLDIFPIGKHQTL